MLYTRYTYQDEVEYWSNWFHEWKDKRDEDRSHWIDVTVQLVNQVKTKIISYINHIMKSREVDVRDEHEDMFNIS